MVHKNIRMFAGHTIDNFLLSVDKIDVSRTTGHALFRTLMNYDL